MKKFILILGIATLSMSLDKNQKVLCKKYLELTL